MKRHMRTSEPIVRELSDNDLLARVERLRLQDRETQAEMIAALGEVDRRGLHLREGFPSLYVYCVNHLQLSEHEAYMRMQVARAAQAYPEIVDMIFDGRVTLTTVALLSKHLNVDNYRQLLEAATHKTKREILEQLAALNPQPAVASSIWQLRTILPTSTTGQGEQLPPEAAAPSRSEASTAVVAARASFERSVVTQLAPERYKLQVTISIEAYEMLRRVQEMGRHIVPSGDPAAHVERALRCWARELERRRTARAERPHQFIPCSSGTRYVPAHVRRSVWQRDSGQCAFIGATGRCPERGFLEFHHVIPYVEGGATTVDNLELRCRAHNAYEAVLFTDTG